MLVLTIVCVFQHEAGFCASCKTLCHEGHKVIDIGTRHDFRCDCGVPGKSGESNINHPDPNNQYSFKISASPCLLLDDDTAHSNRRNRYNHNFQSRYCVCGQHDMGGIMVQVYKEIE